mgnify:CR=1 FL=1
MKMKTALTIAGSDSSGGAGIQADLKTMTANGVYAMSAITALTAQNTTGLQGIFEVSPEFLKLQIDSVFTDIRPDAVKIGMVSSAGLIQAIAEKLKEHKAENIVVDPVMVATSGAKLISDDAIGTLKECLFPCHRSDSEYPGGSGSFRNGDHHGRGNGGSGKEDQRDLSLRGPVKGRTSVK